MKNLKKIVSNVLTFVLIAAMALTLTSCINNAQTSKNPAKAENAEELAMQKTFTVTVVDESGTEESFTMTSSKETVGEALLSEGLIAGENGQYGLVVTTVNGITADYDTDGTYWAFYINGEYATVGVDSAKIESGATYTLKKQK